MAIKDALPLVPKHLAKRLVGGKKDDKDSNQDFYRDFKYIYVDIPEPEEDFPCESFKQSKKKHHNITRLRYCLSPLSPTNLFQIQILFLSAGVNTAGTVGDIYFSIHDDIRPFHLPLHLKKQMFLSYFYFLPKESIIFFSKI